MILYALPRFCVHTACTLPRASVSRTFHGTLQDPMERFLHCIFGSLTKSRDGHFPDGFHFPIERCRSILFVSIHVGFCVLTIGFSLWRTNTFFV